MLSNKFNLGDKVINKQTGLPTSGTIIAITEPTYFIVTYKSRFTPWKELYPDWESKPVYTLLLDQPHKFGTEKDYLRDVGLEEHNNISKLGYRLTPLTHLMNFPEDDLECLD